MSLQKRQKRALRQRAAKETPEPLKKRYGKILSKRAILMQLVMFDDKHTK